MIRVLLMTRVALIDGDKIVYAAGFGSQQSLGGQVIDLDPDYFAFHKAKLMLQAAIEDMAVDEYRLFLTSNDRSNFRFKLATIQPYKEHRQKVPKPVHYEAIRDYMVRVWNAEMVSGMEADDRLAIELTEANKGIDCTVEPIVDFNRLTDITILDSEDKDLNQVPGWHYNPRKRTMYFITELQGWRNLYTQMLTGDTADNIPGIKGLGPKKALKALQDCKSQEELDSIVREIYTDKGHPIERFNEVYSLLYLLRTEEEATNYD